MQKLFIGMCLLLPMLAGCAADPQMSAATTQPHAECLVCKMNFDLACIDVPVDEMTPTYMYNGTTYYFCSDDCRQKFIKQPEKYIGK